MEPKTPHQFGSKNRSNQSQNKLFEQKEEDRKQNISNINYTTHDKFKYAHRKANGYYKNPDTMGNITLLNSLSVAQTLMQSRSDAKTPEGHRLSCKEKHLTWKLTTELTLMSELQSCGKKEVGRLYRNP